MKTISEAKPSLDTRKQSYPRPIHLAAFARNTALAFVAGLLVWVAVIGTEIYLENLQERQQPSFEEARSAVKHALYAEPQNATKRLTYVFYLSPGGTTDRLEQRKLVAEATQVLKEGTRLCPQAPEMHERLGDFLKEGGNFKAAREAYTRAISLSPSNPQIFDSLGDACEGQGNHAAAVHSYESAIRIYARQPLFYLHLGNAYQKWGKKTEAHQAWRRCIAVHDADLNADEKNLCQSHRRNCSARDECARDDAEAYQNLQNK